jgi:hypothetical protein
VVAAWSEMVLKYRCADPVRDTRTPGSSVRPSRANSPTDPCSKSPTRFERFDIRCRSASCHGLRRSASGRFESRWGRSS